ncbi:MAG: ABC transporter permease [Thermoguttaceae bacterium]|nr:ABC transporter permease [Thermoguttaceae bacterium]
MTDIFLRNLGWVTGILTLTTVGLLLVARIPLRYNIRNLSLRWIPTTLTALAFMAVIALLTVMLAFVSGMVRLTQMTGHPGNVLILDESANDEAFSNIPATDVGDLVNLPGLVREGGRAWVSLETYLVVNQLLPYARPGRPQRRFLQMRGIEDVQMAALVHELRLHPGGSWFSPAGVREIVGPKGQKITAIEAVLGEGIAREMAQDRSPEELAQAKSPHTLLPGDIFFLADRTWVVCGLMQSAGTTFDSEVWAKRSLVAGIFGKNTYTTVVARTPDARVARQLCEYINTRYQKAAIRARPEKEYFSNLQETNRQLLVAISFVTVIMAVGGIFGVMNTMFAAVSQRTADIGVLRLLGFSRWQILGSFLLESLLIALVGGALGCALGSLSHGWTATSIVSGSQGGGKFVVLRLVVDAGTLAAGMTLALAMGALGGLLPAWRATRLRPLEALQ